MRAYSLSVYSDLGLTRASLECMEKKNALSFFASDIPAAGHEREPQSK